MDVTKALQGVVPGLTILNTQGGINEQPKMTIRGVGTLSNKESSDPLIIVDGVPLDDLSLINPQDIDNVSVLKMLLPLPFTVLVQLLELYLSQRNKGLRKIRYLLIILITLHGVPRAFYRNMQMCLRN